MKIKIDGTDRVDYIPIESIEINNVLTRQIDTVRFTVEDGSAMEPTVLDEVIISNDAETTRYFAGFIEAIEEVEAASGLDMDYIVQCVDYGWLLEHPEQLVNETYEDETDQAMIQDFMATCCSDIEVSTYVDELKTYSGESSFGRITPREVIETLADNAGGDFYVDYGPTAGAELAHLYFFDSATYSASFDLSDNPDMSNTYPYENLQVNARAPSANRVDVVGGSYVGEEQLFYLSGDGSKKEFDLEYRLRKPSGETSILVWVWDTGTSDWVAQTVGTKYLHDDELGTTYDVLYGYSEKSLEFDTAPPDVDPAVKVQGRPEIPVRIRVEDDDSYTEYGRWIADVIEDKSITSMDVAYARAEVFLAENAVEKPSANLIVRKVGLHAGQQIDLTSSVRGLSAETYVIQRVRTRFEAGGEEVVCDIELGLYDPDLIDLLLTMKRAEEASVRNVEQMDEIVQTATEEIGLDEAIVRINKG